MGDAVASFEPLTSMKISKRHKANSEKVNSDQTYAFADALAIIREMSKAKFDEGLEVHIRTGIAPEKGDQQIRGSVELPHGTGKQVRVAAFVTPEKEKEAKDAGASVVGGEELIAEITQSGKTDFDVAIAQPQLMKNLAKIARVLGPRGLMPSPKNDQVTDKIKETVEKLLKGKVNFKNDNTANVHIMIGKLSFSDAQLVENYETFMEALKKAKPASAKGTYIKSISICSSMGPGIRVNA